ncbi:MAG TPA: class I SAM-dependent methyltransferase [Bacteroidota bacterium]|nr:class I SAM-dependent methyltransferase [Bacteroidota bacterium]
MKFRNTYADAGFANAYAALEFKNTYYLAYRDLPEIISKHVRGKKALDFGCGAGRSTRFLRKLGLEVVGVDISEQMLKKARELDLKGNYHLTEEGDFNQFPTETFDMALSAFTFDNIPTMKKKIRIFRELGRVLKPEGRFINLVSSPEIYTHEWASFSTKDFPENKNARCGETVRIINTDVNDNRPVEDIIWPDGDYRKVHAEARLEIEQTYKPLAKGDEPYRWVNETQIAPWVIYVLRKKIRL